MTTAHFVGSLLAAMAVGLTFIIVAAALLLAFCECTNWAASRREVNAFRRRGVTVGERRAA